MRAKGLGGADRHSRLSVIHGSHRFPENTICRERQTGADVHGVPYRADEAAFDIESMKSLRKMPVKCLAATGD